MMPDEVVREVFTRLHASDPSVRELYHPAAVRYGQDGTVHHGRDEIGAFYESLFPMRSHPDVVSVFVAEPWVATLMRRQSDEGPVDYLDLFEVENGLVRSIRVLLPTNAAAG